jgi:hypothetical protein
MTLRKPEENGRSCRNKITLHWSQYIFRFRNPGATHFIHIQNKRNTKHRATHHYPAFAGLLRLSLFTSSTHLSGPSWLLWLSVLFLLSAAVSSLCCSNGLLLPPVFCGECSFSFSSTPLECSLCRSSYHSSCSFFFCSRLLSFLSLTLLYVKKPAAKMSDAIMAESSRAPARGTFDSVVVLRLKGPHH